jgi:sugar transferase (PEP-CTERM/EpsH1 system associated)
MKILALVHRVPFPPNKGEKIRAFNQLRYLSEHGHSIDLCTFADDPDDRHHQEALLKYCRSVRIISKPKKLNTIRSLGALPSAKPLSVGFYHSFRMRFVIRNLLRANSYDVIFCYSSPMAEFVRNDRFSGRIPVRIMDFVDVDSDKWKQYSEHKAQPMKAVYLAEAHLLARYERSIAREFDASTLVSEEEVRAFRDIAPGANEIVSIPNGVDTVYFGETNCTPPPKDAPLFVFVGQMDYFANIDAVKYFAQDIFPTVREQLPKAQFQIVGRAPTAEVQSLAKHPGIEVTGAVDDIRDYLGAASIMVAPLRIARGIQNKVLEAMAARVPVVASPAAFAGIEGRAGTHALICDDADSYARDLIQLVDDEPLQQRLAREARTLVEDEYAWAPAMRKLEQLMQEKVRLKHERRYHD